MWRNNKLLKIVIPILCVLAAAVYFVSLGSSEDGGQQEERARPVDVEKVKADEYEEFISYTGTIEEDEIIELSFKGPGRIDRIFVEQGEFVEQGQQIASLDTTDALLDNDSSRLSIEQENASLNKAAQRYSQALEDYDKMVQLHEEGGVSKRELDQAELEKNSVFEDLKSSKAALESANVGYEKSQNSLEESVIRAKESGYITQITAREGEVVPAGACVVGMRPCEQLVHIGMSQKDVKKVSVGKSAAIDIDGVKGSGRISNIDCMPDPLSRTYDVEIEVGEGFDVKDFLIGSIANVRIGVGKKSGVWIPIRTIMSDGEDYVYVANKDRALRKNVSIKDMRENEALVEGVALGDIIVTKGMKNIKNGYLISY